MRKLNQKGFSAVEGLLILILVAIIAGTGYYVYHAKQNSDKTLNTTQSNVPAPPKQASALTLDNAKVPPSWKVSSNAVYVKQLLSSADKTDSVSVVQLNQASLKANDAQSFIANKVAALDKSSADSTVGTPVQLQVQTNTGAQNITAYPVIFKDGNGNVASYTKTAYVVANGYYVIITENSPTQAQLTQADQALQAVTIKQ